MDFPSPLSFGDIPEGAVLQLLSTFGWYLNIMQDHLESRPKFSLPQSADPRELAMRPQVQAVREKVVGTLVWGRWAFGPLPHVTYLCLPGLLEPHLICTTSI